MKFKDILKKIGSGIIRDVVPGGGIILDVVNSVLPTEYKLPADATGTQIEASMKSLPPEQRAALFEREFDVKIEEIKQSNETVRAMLVAESNSTHTTRPYIAKGSFHVVAFCVVICISMWAYGVAINNNVLVGTVMEGWSFILALITPFITLLLAYFGILRREHKARLDAATGGSTPSMLSSIISNIANNKK